MNHHVGIPQAISPIDALAAKAITGITYDNFSVFMDKLVRPEDGPEPFGTVERNKYVMDMLYSAVRLREWKFSLSIVEPGFEIWDKQGSLRFLVTQKKIEFATGMSLRDPHGIRKYKITEGLAAANLFNNIKHARELIHMALNNSDASLPDDEFFKPSLSKEEQAAQLDAVLGDEGSFVDAQTAVVQAQTETVPYESAFRSISSDPAAKAFVGLTPEKADIKQCAPTMHEKQVLNHFKSLQGRILTIVDAILSDKQQREAVKTLVNKEFRRELDRVAIFFDNPDDCGTKGEE